MKTEFHPASERGHANHGWLDTWHSFSFATYFNPARERFGCLRVLNDDTVSKSTGFDLHPHNNMEIITIVEEGALEHRDSMGNIQVITNSEVQVMSAGTGLYHAEYNHSDTLEVKFFQLWIFPREKNLTPRYEQKRFQHHEVNNQLVTLVTPDNVKMEDALWIHQDAYISTINLSGNNIFEYKTRIQGNGIFVFIIKGECRIEDNLLGSRDAIAITETDSIKIITSENSKLLFIEVPLN